MSSHSSNFDPTRALARQTLVAHRLAQAIDQSVLKVHYQPEIDLKTGHVQTLEALCRWHDVELNQVAPDEFIAVAEAKGLIAPLGQEILRQVMHDMPDILNRWPHVRVAINVSGLELAEATFAKQFVAAVSKINANYLSHIELELTESIFLYDLPKVRENLEVLRRAGISIAIDDFGTGHSSLARLHTLPFDKIKLDRSFVQALDDPMAQAIIQAMVQLANSFSRTLVAEGIETQKQLEQLTALGCQLGQGYLLCRPCDLKELPIELS